MARKPLEPTWRAILHRVASFGGVLGLRWAESTVSHATLAPQSNDA